MSQYQYEVIRWPFHYDSVTLTVNKSSGGSATTSIPTQTYICDGSGEVVAPIDFVKAFQLAINAALTALGGTAQIEARMGLDGRIQTQNTLADGSRYTVDFNAELESIMGATAADYFVGKLLVAGTGTTAVRTMTYQARGQWHPKMDSQRNTGPVRRQLMYAGRNLRGQETRVVRSTTGWFEQAIRWDYLPAGVMLTARAADPDYAYVAEVEVGEDNTWENMWEYLTAVAADQPFGDNRVYLYEYNDPAASVRSGPFEYILSESEPGLEGVDWQSAVANMGSEYYPVTILLRTQQ
jgi:hypothetical protein